MDLPQLIGAYYTAFASKAEIQSCKNLYLERIESGAGRNQYAMYMRAGLKTVAATLNRAKLKCRGLLELNGFVFDAQDDTVYLLQSDYSVFRTYASIVDDGLPVSITASETSGFVVSGGVFYRLSDVLQTPAQPFIPSAIAVIQGLVVCLEQGTNRFFFSSDDGQTWNALDFQTAEAYPNALVNLVVDHQELWLFGNRRAQIYVLTADPNAPFQAVSGGIVEQGLAAKFALCQLDNSIFWLGQNKDGALMFWRANGYSPVRVSNHAVENTWRSYGANFSDAQCATFQQNGHQCIRLTFPSANGGLGATWNYDASMSPEMAWTEAPWWNPILSRYESHRGSSYVSAFGKILVGDRANGCLYEMSPDFTSDFGYPIRWERRTPHQVADGKRVQYHRLGLFMQTGVGTPNAPTTWWNDRHLSPLEFAGDLAAALAQHPPLMSVDQANAMQAIFNYAPYNQDTPLPPTLMAPQIDPPLMAQYGFFDPAANPMVSMRYSSNGGATWGPYQDRSMGRVGEYSKRIYWTRLGMSRDRVYEFSGMAPVQTAITQGTLEAAVGLS
jgi:hypothetical protein